MVPVGCLWVRESCWALALAVKRRAGVGRLLGMDPVEMPPAAVAFGNGLPDSVMNQEKRGMSSMERALSILTSFEASLNLS